MNNRTKLFYIFLLITLLISIIFRVPIEPFFEYDAKDIFLGLFGIILGTPSAFILTVVVISLELIIVSFFGIQGFIMNLCSTLLFVCLLSYIYSKKPCFKMVIIGGVISTIISTFIMIFYNYVILTSMEYSKIEVINLIIEFVIPFNFFKNLFNTFCICILYKPIIKLLSKYKLAHKINIFNYSYRIANMIFISIIVIMMILPIFLMIISY